mmetsp:Transcript_24034/g.61943  ORF Transcript_24034/g.61943 Transcript_24034/m.61943 type:complete len:204 (+) Transcript_24034:746-1357(+)
MSSGRNTSTDFSLMYVVWKSSTMRSAYKTSKMRLSERIHGIRENSWKYASCIGTTSASHTTSERKSVCAYRDHWECTLMMYHGQTAEPPSPSLSTALASSTGTTAAEPSPNASIKAKRGLCCAATAFAGSPASVRSAFARSRSFCATWRHVAGISSPISASPSAVLGCDSEPSPSWLSRPLISSSSRPRTIGRSLLVPITMPS